MKEKILIIDDDMGIVEGLKNVLEDEGYEVCYALNGRQGFESLKEHPEVRLILLDLMMPIMDGYTFLQEFNQRFQSTVPSIPAISSIPVIVLSAGTIDRQRLKALGVSSCFSKPIDIEEFIEKVEALISS